MGLFTRMGDIISANLNEMVDKYEDPEKMLKQAVGEMESAIRTAMDGAAKVIANEKLISKQMTEQQSEIEHWWQKAETAVRNGDEDVARHALVRKREHEKLQAALTDQFTTARASSQKLRRQIDAMRVRLDEAKRKLVLLTARKQAADARKQLIAEFGQPDFSQAAFSKFDRMCKKVDYAEAETEALLELSGTQDRSDDLSIDLANVDIEAELQKLRQKCRTTE